MNYDILFTTVVGVAGVLGVYGILDVVRGMRIDLDYLHRRQTEKSAIGPASLWVKRKHEKMFYKYPL